MSIQEAVTGTRTGHVDTEGDRIVFDVRGEGTPIALLPGTPGDASVFGLVAGPLAADHTVVTYDPRGFGRSSGNEPRRYEIGQQARDVVAVLRAAGIERAFVVGSSAGAEVGLELATNHPDVVAGVVAHEPPVVRLLPDADELQTRIAEIYRTAWTEGSKAAFFDFLLLTQLPFNAGEPFTAAEVAAIRPGAEQVPGIDFADYYMKHQMLPLTDYLPDLDRIRRNGVKLVAGAGRLSLDLPFGRTARAVAEGAGAPFAVFPGHHGSLSDPSTAEAWTATLRDALASL
ncbi:alpha/beta fold hydrolase [Agromyces larvae]|uniref:Alpha/beta hydrolase n=1 Tax=Agromyces larvae TaxID=2929802 RepID=A0ABY4C8J2_9MICO|nr:alpha/beta hydrolase [Agromyces larvae]UOE44995.1 alpha/beta hydrolase [Agromyces larvae]